MLTKKDFIALADVIRRAKASHYGGGDLRIPAIPFNEGATYGIGYMEERLADFCAAQNPRFNRERWLSYIAGECGPSGGTIKQGKVS